LDGQIFDFTADGGNVYFFFNNADAGTADQNATGNGVTVCGGVLFDGVTKHSEQLHVVGSHRLRRL
jgi:hypothetical protein